MISRRSLIQLTAFSGALVLGFTGCKQGGGDTILVGEFASLTGKEATFGISSHEGTLLAIEEIRCRRRRARKKAGTENRGRPSRRQVNRRTW